MADEAVTSPMGIEPTPDAPPRLQVSLAQSEADVRDAQLLRYQVFAVEMGAYIRSSDQGLDQDEFDPYCDHLLVRDQVTGQVVGTYRILPAAQAKRAGGFYSETEFDLTRILALDSLVEVGRSCVHQAYRRGAAISLLWAGLARYMETRGYDYLIGCASISMADGGWTAVRLYETLKEKHLSPVEWRVFPFRPLPVDGSGSLDQPPVPPLIKGYLRLGAYICGEPSRDPEFNTADLLMLLPMACINRRYARHFLGQVELEPA
jgi:putative hemolysin